MVSGLGHVDAGFRRHQGPAQFATKRAAWLAVAQAEHPLERVYAVDRLACAFILTAGVRHAATGFPASRKTQLVEEQFAFGFRAANGYAITIDVLELAKGETRHAGGPADLLNKVVVLVIEQRRAKAADGVLAAQTHFEAVAGFRLQVGIGQGAVHAGVGELAEYLDCLWRAEACSVLTVDAVGVVELVGHAKLGRQRRILEVAWGALGGLAIEVFLGDVRAHLIVVVAQTW